jgi:membrane protease YdiL (CAAX protease family)
MRKKAAGRRHGTNALIFFALALGISWTSWLLAVGIGAVAGETTGNVLIAIGGLGPALAAIIVLYWRGDKKQRHDYWRRLIDNKVIGGRWYLVMLLLPGAIVFGAILVSLAFGGSAEQLQLVPELRGGVVAFLPFAAYVFLVGPLPEELGWRGFGLHTLLHRYNGLVASLVLAAFWAAWHVPLFFIGDYPLAKFAEDSVRLSAYFANFVPLSILFTWIYIGTSHRTLSAILFHFSINFFGMMVETEPMTETIILVGYVMVAGYVLLRKGPTLGEAHLLR